MTAPLHPGRRWTEKYFSRCCFQPQTKPRQVEHAKSSISSWVFNTFFKTRAFRARETHDFHILQDEKAGSTAARSLKQIRVAVRGGGGSSRMLCFIEYDRDGCPQMLVFIGYWSFGFGVLRLGVAGLGFRGLRV